MSYDSLLHKIQTKTATIGIIGMGYVGIPLALRFAEVGYSVIGFDTDTKKTGAINDGKSYIEHIPSEKIAQARCSNKLFASTDFSIASAADVLIICVPTPLNDHREPDLSYIINAMDSLLPYLRESQLISLESTTYPGTTDEVLLPKIQTAGFKVGDNFYLTYSPEREDPGNKNFSTRTTPKVCGGHTSKCLEIAVSLYGQIIDHIVPVSSTKTAELTKLLENIHRAVNIGLVNEMKIVADKMDIDIHEVIRAAATKPFGFTPYYPGPGLGGHCIPIDPFYLTWKARAYGVHTRFIELAGEVNSAMPDYVVNKALLALNSHQKSVSGSKILILGVAYKKNIDDLRESPSLILIKKFIELGAHVFYSDPHIPTLIPHHGFDMAMESISLDINSINSFDLVLLATDHSAFDYDLICKHSKLIVDTRGIYLIPSKNIIKA